MALKVAVIGSNSDIAKDLIPRIVRRHDVYSFDREQIDVRDYNSCKRLIDVIPDVVINFAGVLTSEFFHESNIVSWREQILVNLIGSYNVARAAIESNKNCKIILIGSKAANSPRATRSAYCASKAGLYEMTKCMILEGIDVFILNIGPCNTKMRTSLNLNEDLDLILSPYDVSKRIIKIIENREWQRVIWQDKIEA